MEAEQEMEVVAALEPVSALQLLQSVYRNPTVGMTTRMRAAIACLPFEAPKLAVTALIDNERDFAAILDRRLKRLQEMEAGKLIEAKPKKVDARLQPRLPDPGGFDHYPTGRDLAILGLPLAVELGGEMLVD